MSTIHYVNWAAADVSHTSRRSLADAGAVRSPRDAGAHMNSLQACYRHELLQASFSGTAHTRRNMTYTMLPLKKKGPAACCQPPASMPLVSA